MFLYPREDVGQVEYGPGGGTHWVAKGLETEGAIVIWQPFERSAYDFGLRDSCAGARREGISGSPFGMGDV
jgi:hypothetical protein